MFNLINAPECASHYEFVVAREIDSEYWFWGVYMDGFKAESVAKKIGGIVIHNVRIQGYEP